MNILCSPPSTSYLFIHSDDHYCNYFSDYVKIVIISIISCPTSYSYMRKTYSVLIRQLATTKKEYTSVLVVTAVCDTCCNSLATACGMLEIKVFPQNYCHAFKIIDYS